MNKARPIGQILLLTTTASLLFSCAIYAPDERDTLDAGLPEQFSLYSDNPYDTTNRWWTTFQSPELDGLIEEALTNSPTIHMAWARLAQADAAYAQARSSLVPTLNYDGRAGTTWTQGDSNPVENYNAGLNAAYEVDLWGRIKSENQARALDREATREQLNTAAITLSARVAQTWTALLAQRLQTEVIRLQIEANKNALELIELRFKTASSSALDVFQQRQTLAGTESLIPLAERNEELQQNELAVLLGQPDFQALEVTQKELPTLGKLPALGIPADVLANRPDVRTAGLNLYAADWQVSAARADRLPALRLTGTLDYNSSDISDLFDDWAANLAASLTGPVFDGGRRKAEVEKQRAIAAERLAIYRETVLNAIKEVENALVSEQKQHEYIERLDARLTAATRSYEESVNRYRNGIIEYTTVLIQLNTLQGLERDRVQAQFDLLNYRINLYKSLGGSWPNKLSAPSTGE
ncbi:efflux transporter outer membrane subunit [Pontiellaceae bacterium B12219]|nr:efflux transporter outer membrane subunit [Pontiellaceae bacterium B12219]